MSEEIRWIYRFRNFARAYNLLAEALDRETLDDLQREGMIQRFEYTFELAWKTLMDRMQYDAVEVDSAGPRKVIRLALQLKYLSNGETWMAMIDDRNSMSHRYSLEAFLAVEHNIRFKYIDAFSDLYEKLGEEAP